MLLKIFTLQFDSIIGKFDDSLVLAFLQNKNIVSVKDHLVNENNASYLILVVTYTLLDHDLHIVKASKNEIKKDESWRSLINPSNEAVFENLRNWRFEISKKEGVPPYIVFNNKQLAEIVSRMPTSLNQLSQIEGIGPAKIKKYGDSVLKLIKIPNNEGNDG